MPRFLREFLHNVVEVARVVADELLCRLCPCGECVPAPEVVEPPAHVCTPGRLTGCSTCHTCGAAEHALGRCPSLIRTAGAVPGLPADLDGEAAR